MFTVQQITPKKPTFNRFFAPNRKQIKRVFNVLLMTSALGLPCHHSLAAELSVNSSPVLASQVSTLTWHDAISRTLADNPSLKAFGYQLSAHAGRVQQAGLEPNPELVLSVEDAFGSGNYKEMDSAETSLSISWVLEGNLRNQRVNTAQARTSMLEIEQDIQRIDATATTARLYITALALQTRLQQAGDAITLARNVLKMIDARIKAGKAPNAEAARAKVDLSRRLLEHEDIEHELAVTLRQLAAQWGEKESAKNVSFTQVRGNIFTLPKVTPYNELQHKLNENPRLQYFVTSERWEESQLALAKAQGQAQWRVSAGIKHLSQTNDQALLASVSVPLTIFDRQQGRIAEAHANMELNRAEREAEQVRLETAIFGLHQELLHNLHIIESYRTDILPALEIALDDTRRAYDLGRYSFLEWQAVQREYLEAKSTLVEACVAAHLKAIEIERLTGVALSSNTQEANAESK
jgi:outer membrane protein, heavy metal efflux system